MPPTIPPTVPPVVPPTRPPLPAAADAHPVGSSNTAATPAAAAAALRFFLVPFAFMMSLLSSMCKG